MKNKYIQMTSNEFDEILEEIIQEEAHTLLSIGGVYEILAEHFNNEVLERWVENNPEKVEK